MNIVSYPTDLTDAQWKLLKPLLPKVAGENGASE